MTMGDDVKFRLHVDEFQRAADRLAHYSKRDGETFMKAGPDKDPIHFSWQCGNLLPE